MNLSLSATTQTMPNFGLKSCQCQTSQFQELSCFWKLAEASLAKHNHLLGVNRIIIKNIKWKSSSKLFMIPKTLKSGTNLFPSQLNKTSFLALNVVKLNIWCKKVNILFAQEIILKKVSIFSMTGNFIDIQALYKTLICLGQMVNLQLNHYQIQIL